jgi:eukaryotic-like serine/threonine-protein kinase
MIGDVIEHYRVLDLVGRGAMGIVYKALDLNLDRQVAIKVMSAEARVDPDFVERFRQEARMQAALNHPNIAQLFDYFLHDGAPVAVMEYIDGQSMEQLIRRRGPIPAHECIPLFKQALRGVAAAHRAGIIHRDLKTANLMITRDGVVKVMDFGIAKRQSAMGATKASTSIGSPLYMAPEQILGHAVDWRTDVYALGITLYQLLSGQPPFNPRGKTEYSVLNSHVNDLPEPPTVHFQDIPQPLVDAVMCAMAKEPDARFQSADDFMNALPDVFPTNAATAPVNTTDEVALPQVGPTGTVAIPRMGPTGTIAIPRVGPTGTVAIPRLGPTGTIALQTGDSAGAGATPKVDTAETVTIEWSPPPRAEPPITDKLSETVAFDYAPPPAPTAQGLRGAPLGLMQRLRSRPSALVAALVPILVLAMLIHHAKLSHATLQNVAQAPSKPAVATARPVKATPPPAIPKIAPQPQEVANSSAAPPAAPLADAPAPTTGPATAIVMPAAPVRQDLAGTWRGAYVDASGKQLLRVVRLNIRRVDDAGGIEGTLRYEAASGEGDCKLQPRGSTYVAGEQRLQLSPVGCSPHYPKELGVPLDFNAVTPQASTLKDGRIEAPTGDMIRVKLTRVGGA